MILLNFIGITSLIALILDILIILRAIEMTDWKFYIKLMIQLKKSIKLIKWNFSIFDLIF